LSSPGGTRLASPQFLLLWQSSFVFYLSFYLLLPVLPLYVLAPTGFEPVFDRSRSCPVPCSIHGCGFSI
jgi:hypothetical protein